MRSNKSNQKANSLRANRGGTRKSSQQSGMESSRGVMVMYKRLQPPELMSSPIFSRRLRYRINANVSQESLSNNDLCRGLGGVFAVTAILGYPVCASVKLTNVEIWSPTPTMGSSVTAALQWDTSGANGDFAGPSQIVSDSSMDPSRPAYIKAKPPKLTLCGFWKSCALNDTDRIALITAPSGSIIDFVIKFTTNEALGPSASLVLVGASVGGYYHKQILNGNAVVVSLNTTV